jgi:hypothetical protein
MHHIQVSIKFNEDLFNEIVQTTSTMRMNKHAFIVSAVEETLKLIKNRGKEKLPLLVAQARTAEDHARDSLPLPIRSDAGPPGKPRKARKPSPFPPQTA